jgi:hypothetical protein
MARRAAAGCIHRMTRHAPTAGAHPGDRIEVRGIPGAPARQGRIVEVLGRTGHEHFRVRWNEGRESLFFPSEGAIIVHPSGHREEHRP